jgi:hypothetical protein
MTFIKKSEKTLGRFTIHGLTHKLVVLQVLVFVVLVFNPLGYTQLLSKVNIGNTTFLSDLIHTLAFPIVPPGSFISYLFMFFGTQLFFLFGTSLESLWGEYKFNLYVWTHVLITLVIRAIFPEIGFFPVTLYSAIFYAFATYFPEFKLMLMLILPTPVRLLAFLGVGLTVFTVLDSGTNPLTQACLLTMNFGAYLLFHFHLFSQKQVQKKRRKEFQAKVELPKNELKAFHQCNTCKRTENDDKNLEFRICNDGEEYCMEHLLK